MSGLETGSVRPEVDVPPVRLAGCFSVETRKVSARASCGARGANWGIRGGGRKFSGALNTKGPVVSCHMGLTTGLFWQPRAVRTVLVALGSSGGRKDCSPRDSDSARDPSKRGSARRDAALSRSWHFWGVSRVLGPRHPSCPHWWRGRQFLDFGPPTTRLRERFRPGPLALSVHRAPDRGLPRKAGDTK